MEFADILEGIARKPAALESATRVSSDFWHVLNGLGRAGPADFAQSRAAYRDGNGSEAPRSFGDAAESARSVDPIEIAFELDLDAAQSLTDLKLVRRLFARDNHPDRVPPAERERANIRMTVANALIDRAAERFAGR